MAEQEKVQESEPETHTVQEIGKALQLSDPLEDKSEIQKIYSDFDQMHHKQRTELEHKKDFSSYERVVKRKLSTIFENYINPSNVIHVFWNYDRNVLIEGDIELVEATVHASGITAGALKLLELLPKYKKWIPCLIQVLKDEKVKLDHVAEMILHEIDYIQYDTSVNKAVKDLAKKDLLKMKLKKKSGALFPPVCQPFEELEFHGIQPQDSHIRKASTSSVINPGPFDESLERVREQDNFKYCTRVPIEVNVLTEKDAQNVRMNMNLDCPSYDGVVKRELFTIFEKYIYPSNVIHVFWKYDPNILTEGDKQLVDTTVHTLGIAAGALKLLELLPKYKNWIPCLIRVLKDEHVELGHVAEMILHKIEKIKSDTSVDKTVKALAEKDLSELRLATELESFSYNEVLRRKVQPIFGRYINPRSVVHVLWKYDPKVLRKGDIEYVEAVTKRKGTAAGIETLFRLLTKYKTWLPCLIQALRDKEVNQEHVAEVILEAMYNIKHDTSVPIEVRVLAGKDVQIMRLKMDLEKKMSEKNETIIKLNQQIEELKMKLGTDRANEKALAEDNTIVEESQTKLATDDLLNVIPRNTKEQSMKESLMLYFAKCGQLKALEDLIEGDDNINIDKYDSEGKTALMYAASAGSLDCVTLIVGRKPDVNVVDKRGQTPLMLAARSNGDNIQCLQKLLDARADVNVKDTLGNTALAYAAKEGNVQCVQALVDSGTDVNTSDKYDKTPLMLASRSNAECVKILLKAGASPDVKDADQPPLIYAVNFGNVDCVQVLLKTGSDVNISDKMAKTALMFAAEHSGDNVLCLQKLLDAEADVDIKDLKGRTALAYAASAGNVNCVDLLLRSGGQKHLNTKDKNERTPLMLASKSYGDNVQCVETLLSSGADINMKDSDGQTALDYATKCGNIKCQDLLHFFKMKLLFSNTE